MKIRNKIALTIFAIFYVLFGVYISLTQESIIYHPFTQDFESCSAFSDSDKVTYKGTRMYVKESLKGVVILYHGNAGSACDRHFYANQFAEAGYGYIIPEYTGYSNDVDMPSHKNIKSDVRNVVSYVQEMQYDNVVVIGESIGTGFASFHTSISEPNNVLLISPFSSLLDIAKGRFWFYPTKILVDNAFDNEELLKNYNGPLTIIHGNKDEVIPQKLGWKLYESLNFEDKDFISIDGFGHNNLFTTTKTFEIIHIFLD